MLNLVFVEILERLIGRKTAAVLGEISGTTERTWRTRQMHGWSPSEKQIIVFRQRTREAHLKRLVQKQGWSPDEAGVILDELPSTKYGAWLPTADLIYNFSPLHGAYCPETISLARQFDLDCAALVVAVNSGNTDQARAVFVTMLDWLLSFCPPHTDTEDAHQLRGKLSIRTTMEMLLAAVGPLHEALICHILSCWDVEFCAGYFEKTMQPYPLFQLVMPRLSPDIEVEPGTGRILRAGRKPKKRVFESSMLRLMDFLFVMVAWRRDGRIPDAVPRIMDFAAWSNLPESRLVSWRDETTRFTAAQLEHLWTEALEPDSAGIYPAIPSPMFVCAHFLSPLLKRENGHPVSLIDSFDTYKGWWERNRDRLIAKGLQFGAQAWPNCLTAQPADGRSFASFCSAELSGRSSSPRDCQ
jgi:hypothetical protein